LTSFVQQSGHRSRNRKVSNSVIITRVVNSYRQKQSSIINKYSVEQIDKDTITEFIQAKIYRKQVLSRYFDQGIDRTDCYSTDSIFCNQYKTSNRPRKAGINIRIYRAISRKEEVQEKERIQADTEENKKAEVIVQQLKVLQELYKSIIAVIDRLQNKYIYCILNIKKE
jgi:hypothetical protein